MLEYYDTDKMFPTYLFGGQVNGVVSHCYPLNGNFSNPEVPGVNGILQWYHTAITNINLYGPTYFSEIINTASKYIPKNKTVGFLINMMFLINRNT